jgi:two-component system CheB/CheR fusion protein
MGTSHFTRRPLRVLVVDDLRDATDSLGLLVKFWGFTPFVAYDGPTALALARNARPDVVLLETGLRGGMDGYEVARKLRELPGLGKLLIVAVTCYGQPEDLRRCWDTGIDFHFVKPVDPEELRQLLDVAEAALYRAVLRVGVAARAPTY